MYRPERRIVKYLQERDPDLNVRWNRERGRWQVTWKGRDAWCVCEEDGSYRPLDERVLTQQRMQDLWQHRSTKDYMRLQQEERHRIEGLRKHKQRDDFRQFMVEEGHQKVVGVGTFTGWSPPQQASA